MAWKESCKCHTVYLKTCLANAMKHLCSPFSDRILHDQNEGLHQSLMKTAVRMECLGEEFLSGQKLLETELQRTRMELSLLMDRFKR